MRISDWSSDVCSSDLRIGRADTGEQCDHGQRLYPRLAQRIHSRAAEPLRKRSVRARDQRGMGECGRRRAQGLELLGLNAGIGDMVLAPPDMGVAHIHVEFGTESCRGKVCQYDEIWL